MNRYEGKKGNETKSDRKRWRKTNKKKKSEECATYAPLEIKRHDLAEYGRDSDTVMFHKNIKYTHARTPAGLPGGPLMANR